MRHFVLPCAAALLAVLLAGCGEDPRAPAPAAPHEGDKAAYPKEKDKGGERAVSLDKEKAAVDKDAPPRADMDKASDKVVDKFHADKDKAAAEKDKTAPADKDKGDVDFARKPAVDEPLAGADRPPPGKRPQDLPAGVLTAGSFDDNQYPGYLRKFAGKAGQNPYLGSQPGRLLGRRLEVRVKNVQGAPVGNARVRVAAAGGGPAVELLTRSDGRAVFLSSWDQAAADGELEIMAAAPGAGEWVKQRAAKDAADCTVLLPSAAAPLPRNLDLAFVLDTTGSMGDELEYLKSEIKNIAAAVHKDFPDVNQRYGLVLYRDEHMGDAYVTRVFDFTPSIDEFQKHLADQSAQGGGDLPEAMHRGLEEAIRLRWRDADTARVLFLVADAPPHAADVSRTLECVDILRKKGVAIYPVAASCPDATANEATEFVFRAAAFLTGAQYLFLTDDSGVGDSHGEPHLPFYRVEKLNRLMARMISGELSGRRTDPAPGDVLRTVGAPPRQGRQD